MMLITVITQLLRFIVQHATCFRLMLVFDINVSHGNVATRLMCGEIFHNDFIANLPLTLQLNEL